MLFPVQKLERFERQEIRWMVNTSDIPVHNRPLSELSENNPQKHISWIARILART